VNVGLADSAPAAGTPAPTVTLPAPVPSAAPLAATARLAGNLQVYFGNLHSHTSYSDGSGTPQDAFRHARDVADLDFLAVTEHNHAAAEQGAGDRADGILIATQPDLYDGESPTSLRRAATSATADGSFVALYGQEFSTISSGNHVNVFDVRGVIDVANGDFGALFRSWLPSHKDSTGGAALLQFNHPDSSPDENEYGRDDFASDAEWVSTVDRQVELMEVFNGPGTKPGEGLEPSKFSKQYLRYLNLGFHLGPTGNQDNHHLTWGTLTEVRTGVVAPALTKADLLAALKARHVYASTDRNLRFVARVIVQNEEHLLGDVIAPPTSGTPFEISYQLEDADEPQASYRIDVFSDVVGGTDIAEELLPEARTGNTASGTPARIQGLMYDGARRYYLIKLTQTNQDDEEDTLWTAPIWFEQPSAQPVPDPGAANEGDFVASKNSGIFHVSGDCRSAKTIKAENRVAGASAAEGRQQHEGCPLR
jgi:hypothetical protein